MSECCLFSPFHVAHQATPYCLNEPQPNLLEQGTGKQIIGDAARIARDGGTQFWPWPDEPVGFREHDPGTRIVQSEASLRCVRNFDTKFAARGPLMVIGSTTAGSPASSITTRTTAHGRSLAPSSRPRACSLAHR